MRQVLGNAQPTLPLGTTFATTVRRLGRAASFVAAVLKVAAERRALAELDDHMLKDIGQSRSLAAREYQRGLLDVPEDRLVRRS